ncbi:hypothetical protein KCTC32516_01400 [Polaribacter huanghezhanensis]|uniref:DUF4136 domain-containing protein n=1 Tax=Polaribacter huanghezhanensis TaxID=1354726 RepID=UPI0026474BAC|nr:DUF4136 domain-containing protein [Polaribacter huanghezhanensis]WKD86049.1 hypothetical protein KCTC32516_01400 [Polaribacter huanghezhanensis]
MKKLILLFLSTFLLASCSSVRVVTDYDSKTDFSNYKTFAFYKSGIDKAKISDLDKRRILKAIEVGLLAKGFKKSENPDMLVSIFAKSRKTVDVDSRVDYPISYYYPSYYYGRDRLRITKQTEGTLFIDFIDVKSKKLVWQGIGSGALGAITGAKKAERIQTFVKEIISKFPPDKKK